MLPGKTNVGMISGSADLRGTYGDWRTRTFWQEELKIQTLQSINLNDIQ